jgi:pimeloyl-ACP methyl ester carboxylesterase
LLPVLVHPKRRTAELVAEVLAMADEIGEEVLDRQLGAQVTRVDERTALARVAVPTLIIAAAQDALCPVWKHEEMHRLVPGSTLVVLDGVGHLSPLEAPGPVASRMTEWLTEGSRAAGRLSSSPA